MHVDEPSPLPPFTLETAIQKVRLAEDAWNGRDPARVALAYSIGQPLAQSQRHSCRGAPRSKPSSRRSGSANSTTG
jgi:nuclear transport factor 2 (NTF2) superfamily protein